MMNGSTMIDRLVVTHRRKLPDGSVPRTGIGNNPVPTMSRGSLRLDTCLREVAIELVPEGGSIVSAFDDAEIQTGVNAYQLLLEIATGLRSAIPGETNVFGQFRRAWQAFLSDGQPAAVAGLTPVIHRLFNDTKAVRKNWLEGVGGTSYGSLVRRLIEPRRQDRVLFVGAGELMQSMLPLFEKYRLGVWNHRIIKPMTATVDYIFPPGHGQRAAIWADHVILTTPQNPHNDRNWHTWLRNAHPRTVVHLGHHHTGQSDWDLGIDWEPGITVFDLGDVFALRREQDDYRSNKLDSARVACVYLANLLHEEIKFVHRQDAVPGVNLVAA